MQSHNGKENPIGIETGDRAQISPGDKSHNGKENPIGIETE